MIAVACSSGGESVGDSEDALADARANCSFGRGDKASRTLPGAHIPEGKIDKNVVLMQENRSFDHYFGQLNDYVAKHKPGLRDYHADGAVAEGQKDGTSTPRRGKHAPELCHADTDHDWWAAHEQYDNGKNDGFFLTNDKKSELGLPASLTDGERALWYYDERDLPFYYDLATTFGVGDRYFSSVLGPTYPNRDFLYAGTSKGVTFDYHGLEARDDRYVPFRQSYDGGDPSKDHLIFDLLERNQISWHIYSDGKIDIAIPGPFGWSIDIGVKEKVGLATAIGDGVGPHGHFGFHTLGKFKGMDDFFGAAKNGDLPSVSFVDPNFTGGASQSNDEHPPSNIQPGEDFVSRVVRALMSGKDWNRTALFITWDENGGIYDHVEPPKACKPDNVAPTYHEDADEAYAKNHRDTFDRYGFRVPVLVVSPWAKPHHVSHTTYDHTSLIRFIETRFDLPALTARDANAGAMLDFFDFSAPSFNAADKEKGWPERRPQLDASGMQRDGDAAKQRVKACADKYTHGK
jgi:phospholipase C